MQAYLQERDDKGKPKHRVQDLLREELSGGLVDQRGQPISSRSSGRYQDPRRLAEMAPGGVRKYGPEEAS
jgi:hypothetical protein